MKSKAAWKVSALSRRDEARSQGIRTLGRHMQDEAEQNLEQAVPVLLDILPTGVASYLSGGQRTTMQ